MAFGPFRLFFHGIEQIYNFFGGFLNYSNKISFLKSTINDNFGYSASKLFIFFASLGEISYVAPQFSAIFKVNEKLGDVGMRAFQGVAKNLTGAVGLKLNIDWGVAAFCKGDGLRVYLRAKVPEKKM